MSYPLLAALVMEKYYKLKPYRRLNWLRTIAWYLDKSPREVLEFYFTDKLPSFYSQLDEKNPLELEVIEVLRLIQGEFLY